MKKKYILITLVSALVIAGGAAGAGILHMQNATKAYDNIIYPGVAIEDLDLSGKTKDEAVKLITEKYGEPMSKKKININGTGKTYTIDYSKLNAKYNIEETVEEAFNYGKTNGIFERYKLIKSPVSKQFKLKSNYDSEPLKELIAGIQKETDKAPVNASLTMAGSGKFSITPEKLGAKLNTEKLERDIIDKIEQDFINHVTSDIEVQAPIDDIQATVTSEVLSKVNTKISSFSTSFSGSNANRISNIALATKSVSGKLLMPGENFSFNEVVGRRTAERGYKEAGVIINNQLESGIGGGICQVSTTLYNAVIRANINSTERQHHSLPSSYVGLGMDATVDYGNIDYKFTNTLQYPVFIEGYVGGNKVTFNIYSDKSLTNRTYDLVSETYDTIQPNIQYIDDANMYEGQTEIVKKAYVGYKVRVYKITYENGKMISKEKISDDTYKKIDGVIKRGTKKKPSEAEPTPAPASPAPSASPETTVTQQ
ncbi:VanW family protein [Clostridium sp. SYSU_GA19001]|uniref:VanW family protein n=1 Tax=Clostridium caldaquaticum TaxID=2940653 RepID=UPI0020774BBA|nr:VanW family protein [Clostridium caldaquaticum]MCM8711829.1 VanW family protein [Clostridium caldaquaticum]